MNFSEESVGMLFRQGVFGKSYARMNHRLGASHYGDRPKSQEKGETLQEEL